MKTKTKTKKLTQAEMLDLVLDDLKNWIDLGGNESDCSMVYAYRNGFHLHAANLWLGTGAASPEVEAKIKNLKINHRAEMREINQLCDEAFIYVCPDCRHHAFKDFHEGESIYCFSCGKTAFYEELKNEKNKLA